ncbi:MAG: hypothetical protein NTU69_08760 [Proteobacteria bacterium]|nr:hypothetical protein [Pseudomonadota bacterium]
MPTKNARVNVVLEKPLYLVVEKFAGMREMTLDTKKAIDHKDVWG